MKLKPSQLIAIYRVSLPKMEAQGRHEMAEITRRMIARLEAQNA